jgi:sigma-B regulation protein RsbU (phosphoserine phosphatase)
MDADGRGWNADTAAQDFLSANIRVHLRLNEFRSPKAFAERSPTSAAAPSCEEAAVNDPRADLPPAESPAPTPARILIADDEAASRKLLALTLKAFGYEVRIATNGAEAVEMAAAEPPDILLLDFQMPELNGVEVCAALRNHEDAALREIPIIMLTAHDGEDAEVACLQAGANDFVAKPVARASLLARIETQLRLRSLNTALRTQNEELARWREAHVADLEAAQRVQRAILPRPEETPGWRIETHYGPMIQVGGDIYGIEARKDGVMIWLADATGHGVAAALCTTLAAILFQRAALATDDPLAVLVRVNAGLCGIFHGKSLMSAACARILADGSICFASAGHPPLLVHRTDGDVETLAVRSTLLGLQESFAGDIQSVRLGEGDRALLFTDGLHSARREDGERQSMSDVALALAATGDLDTLVEQMRGHSAFDDDVSAILLHREAGDRAMTREPSLKTKSRARRE